MSKAVVGWDIGGAHVKVVALDAQGKVVAAFQRSCALWKGLPLLRDCIAEIIPLLSYSVTEARHVVTMTGELVDLFANRAQGVRTIAETVQAALPTAVFYHAHAGQAGFSAMVTGIEPAVASMNWHAAANCLAHTYPAASMLVMDIGSTTTDITLCAQGELLVSGRSDAERMRSGGLLYSGVVRTPLMAFGPRLQWQGSKHYLAAEYFATTADVYRVLDQLAADHDLADTADGQDKSQLASMRRLARMVGYDVEEQAAAAWHGLAQAFATAQQQYMLEAIRDVWPDTASSPQQLLGLGAGAFLCADLASLLGLEYQPASASVLADNEYLQTMAMVCFPAYAVARLWQLWH